MEHAIAAQIGPNAAIHSPWDYLRDNRWKIALRLFGGVILFWILIDVELVGKITALLAGFSYETSMDSLQQRASRPNGKQT